ncbi:hypothetical protein C6P40_004271, partial [Pichia californica]
MSFNSSSFFSIGEDTFANRKNRNILPSLTNNNNNNDVGNVTVSNIDERSIYPETLLSHNLSSHQISPYIPIKSLIESPFKSVHAQSTPFKDPNNAESNLKLKIRAHQQNFQDSMNTMQSSFNIANKQVSKETYLNSAFNSKRSVTRDTSNTNIIPLESFRNTNLTNYNKYTVVNNGKNTGHSVTQDLDNPYFIEALGRIVNKESEIRKLLYTVLVFLIYKFLRSIIRLFVYSNPIIGNFFNNFAIKMENFGDKLNNENISITIKWFSSFFTFENILKMSYNIERVLTCLIGLILITSLYRLLKPQDKCLDLPLTKAQRKILGLSLNEDYLNKQHGDSNNSNINNDDDEYEEDAMMKKLLSTSPQRMNQPIRIVMPENKGLDDVMGSLNSLAINSNNKVNSSTNFGNINWNSRMKQKGHNIVSNKADNLENIKN